ncbi:GNAT family N-acetyltransferase [Acidipila sp. EB88]|uniref:GNAT family N-acetyltransferase n=1 Tax=Acidipila sp. EB88 TaxID=2305226 RepID=UPI000F5E8DA4|nr:GNAT family N-acetyltransferase [Acidipila sp. EB88]RRA47758.1 GNAT family N-acetyltransferase [Acidipila sp. EB88]
MAELGVREIVTAEQERALGNAYFEALCTEQAEYALGGALAKRFLPDVIPFGGLREDTVEALDALKALMEPGEKLFVMSRGALPQAGLVELASIEGRLMVLPESAPESEPVVGSPEIEELGPENFAEMIALKAVAFPGFFGPRAAMLGKFAGIRVDGALVAMVGERLAVPGMREISAVCTHPEHRGRGYAEMLIRHRIRAEARTGWRSFLGVDASNLKAQAIYRRLGFVPVHTVYWHHLQRPV